MSRPALWPVAALCALSLVGVACSDDDDDDRETPTPASSGPAVSEPPGDVGDTVVLDDPTGEVPSGGSTPSPEPGLSTGGTSDTGGGG